MCVCMCVCVFEERVCMLSELIIAIVGKGGYCTDISPHLSLLYSYGWSVVISGRILRRLGLNKIRVRGSCRKRVYKNTPSTILFLSYSYYPIPIPIPTVGWLVCWLLFVTSG